VAVHTSNAAATESRLTLNTRCFMVNFPSG
jgi:hypothetical protein